MFFIATREVAQLVTKLRKRGLTVTQTNSRLNGNFGQFRIYEKDVRIGRWAKPGTYKTIDSFAKLRAEAEE